MRDDAAGGAAWRHAGVEEIEVPRERPGEFQRLEDAAARVVGDRFGTYDIFIASNLQKSS